jgi:hypothetical protein
MNPDRVKIPDTDDGHHMRAGPRSTHDQHTWA